MAASPSKIARAGTGIVAFSNLLTHQTKLKLRMIFLRKFLTESPNISKQLQHPATVSLNSSHFMAGTLLIKKLGPGAILPTRGSPAAAGLDLCAAEETVCWRPLF
jgi:hypothetical protein